jgi:uncharacterized protein (DUF1697 family)
MARYVAFLRAINVGGHTVKMADLRGTFEALGLANVETFIASGNVIFEATRTTATTASALESRIEAALQDDLGYRVDTFIRTAKELRGIAAYQPFGDSEITAPGSRLFVAFVGKPPAAELVDRLVALSGGIDSFAVHGREVHWLVRGRYSDSRFSGTLLERTLGMPATVRGAATVAKIAAKLG